MAQPQFKLEEAVRASVPAIIGIVGSTGSGKTGSALELAHGFQDIQGGDIGLLETDGKRSLVYAGAPLFSEPSRKFKFKRAALDAPFSPLNYKAGLEFLVSQGIKHAIIDSTSHLHEGEGGTLDAHAKEVERIKQAWGVSADKANFPAWVKPKSELTQFIQFFKRLDINLIFCFRAKEKMKVVNNKPVDAGWQPIANEELFFEMDLACLLLPNSDGQPIWDHSEHKPIKALPQHFRPMFNKNPRLTAELGRKIATWCKGGEVPTQQASAPSKPALVQTESHPADELLAGASKDSTPEPEIPLDGALPKPKSPGVQALELNKRIHDCKTLEEVLAFKEMVLKLPEDVRSLVAPEFNAKKNSFKGA